MLYYVSLILVILVAFMFFRNNNIKLLVLTILVGIYVIYSDSTGNTATDFKSEMVDSLNESAKDFASIHKTEGFDETKHQENVE